MATLAWQSQFRRTVSALVLGALIACGAARGDEPPTTGGLQSVPPSGYQPVQGEPFFLLSDTTFGSDESAQVRVEVPGELQYGEVERYGGVDLVVYRVPEPLEFLARQRNLHRPAVEARHHGEGLANTLTQLWDRWYKASRRVWQRVASFELRRAATEAQPQLSYGSRIAQPPEFSPSSQFQPLPGMELVARFRYPVMRAKPIQPPAGVKLPGSSSDFTPIAPGNIMVPLGRLGPGLYLVEGIVGEHRANTLVFVSDTQVITKTSGGQMLAWTADRRSGRPVGGAQLRWSDGAGLLASAESDALGIAVMSHASPERSYLVGVDRAGGVFVSENFYYDSEIYNTKLYAFTDRPLYRPGDEVMLKVIGREFLDARNSAAAKDAELKLEVFDPAGTALFATPLAFTGAAGADTRFRLPANAPAGGYDLRLDYRGDLYGAAFRVAEYIKPHFDINLLMDKPDLRTGDPIHGRILLAYPDGKPVAGAHLTLAVRAQQITMVDGEMQYAGQVQVSLEQQELVTDAHGAAELSLPAASRPSRYAVTVLASDGAAYRVRITREFLVERGVNPWRLSAPRHFTRPGEAVDFALAALGQGGRPPVRWEAQRLESREILGGELAAGAKTLRIGFDRPGSYTVGLRDSEGNLLGAASHWVAGAGLEASPGSVEIVLDKDRYRAGEVAEALITFPERVEDALLTLERDRVEQHGVLSHPGNWLSVSRVAPNQFRARIPVGEDFAPNITFSVLYLQGHDYVFANAGLVVEQPGLALEIRPERERYQPGETVNVDIAALFDGHPAPAHLTVSVVDEMVYVLQPEIAPPIGEFFDHLRRNNVRTAASFSFISYDMARSYSRGAPGGRPNPERAVKVLERPRRDDKDTAAWEPDLLTGADGQARLSFVMPDSLTRWRITVRAADAQGRVGQKTQYVLSDQAAYVKWTGPRRFREGDEPIADLVVFNRGEQAASGELALGGAGLQLRRELELAPGPNHVSFPLAGFTSGELRAELRLAGQTADRLALRLERSPRGWTSPRRQVVPLAGRSTPLALPADARNLRLAFAGTTAQHFMQVADDLIDYPWGCVEQTASRLIPLALAYQSQPAGSGPERLLSQPLPQLLQSQRERLVALAGPGAVFGWWSYGTRDSAFLTGYAYFADWYASRALGLALPPEHWNGLLDVYARSGTDEPLLQRALLLWWMRRMGLPIDTLLRGVEQDLDHATPVAAAPRERDSVVLAAPASPPGLQLTELLVGVLRRELALPERPGLAVAAAALQASPSPFAGALLRLAGRAPEAGGAAELLARVGPQQPTLERAMTLVWLQQELAGGPGAAPGGMEPRGWNARLTRSGRAGWQWPSGTPLPAALELAADPPPATVAVVDYDSDGAEPSRLPVRVIRRLYRLVADGETLKFRAERVPAEGMLASNALYVDEVELVPEGQARPRYGLLEVPLPPGGEVEGTTWGLQIRGLPGGDGYQPLERPVYQSASLSYAVPVESLDAPLKLRQLVRFGARGRFALPPARFHRMYQPDDKAFEGPEESWRHAVR